MSTLLIIRFDDINLIKQINSYQCVLATLYFKEEVDARNDRSVYKMNELT